MLLPFLTTLAQRDCILKKDADSIKVYTCAAEHLNFRTIKATFSITAKISRLVAMVLDIENYVKWQYNTIQARTVSKINDHEIVYYTEISAPWPVSNRDMVTHLEVVQDAVTKTVTITTQSFPGLIPANAGIVRVPMSHAIWNIVPVSSTRVSVEYVLQIDPGGAVPAWMVNMVATQAPYDSFRNLKEKINTINLKTMELGFIKD